MSEKTLDQYAVEAAENHVRAMYTRWHCSTIKKNWGCSDEELARLEFTGEGYLVCGIKSSRILAHEEKWWMIEVIPDIGIEVEPEVIKVSPSVEKKAWVEERQIAS